MYEVNDHVNGTYGFLYNENGQEVQGTQEFEANLELEKEAVKQAGKFTDSHKVKGGAISGSVRILKLDSRLQKKVAEDPTAKYNYMGKLADPTARGEEAVLLIGVSFDSTPLIGWQLGELVEVSLDFTADDFRYVDSID